MFGIFRRNAKPALDKAAADSVIKQLKSMGATVYTDGLSAQCVVGRPATVRCMNANDEVARLAAKVPNLKALFLGGAGVTNQAMTAIKQVQSGL